MGRYDVLVIGGAAGLPAASPGAVGYTQIVRHWTSNPEHFTPPAAVLGLERTSRPR